MLKICNYHSPVGSPRTWIQYGCLHQRSLAGGEWLFNSLNSLHRPLNFFLLFTQIMLICGCSTKILQEMQCRHLVLGSILMAAICTFSHHGQHLTLKSETCHGNSTQNHVQSEAHWVVPLNVHLMCNWLDPSSRRWETGHCASWKYKLIYYWDTNLYMCLSL